MHVLTQPGIIQGNFILQFNINLYNIYFHVLLFCFKYTHRRKKGLDSKAVADILIGDK